MSANTITRGIGLYQVVFAFHFFWISVVQRSIGLINGYGILIEVPLLLFPSLILVVLCVFSGYHLLILSSQGYILAAIVQLFLVLRSLLVLLAIRPMYATPLDAMPFLINGILFLILVHPAVGKAFDATWVPLLWQTHISRFVKRTTIGVIILSLIVMIGWCGVSVYTGSTMSAYDAMLRLIPATDGPTSREVIRESLLEQLPMGSTSQTVTTYLEIHGVPADTFRGGQFIRYQISNGDVLALFSNPPWVIDLICSQVHYGVRFVMRNDLLHDIVIEDYTYCL